MRTRPMLRLFCAALAVAVIIVMTGCGSVRRGEPFTGSLSLTPEAQRGQLIFMRHCHECHPGGEGGLGPGINDKPLPRFLIRTQVRRGFGAMPAFPSDRLASGDLEDLLDYMAALRRSGRAG
jgi:mono/diheme cytochrome c family protein